MSLKFRNGIFLVTEESNCPLYNTGEELAVQEGILKLPAGKPTCLNLAREVVAVASEHESFEKLDHGEVKKTKFDCGGCIGLIRFEFKKEKGYQTLQMKLLAA